MRESQIGRFCLVLEPWRHQLPKLREKRFRTEGCDDFSANGGRRANQEGHLGIQALELGVVVRDKVAEEQKIGQPRLRIQWHQGTKHWPHSSRQSARIRVSKIEARFATYRVPALPLDSGQKLKRSCCMFVDKRALHDMMLLPVRLKRRRTFPPKLELPITVSRKVIVSSGGQRPIGPKIYWLA